MQTGEGKTLAAVPAVAWYARRGQGVHVLTANDYLARRDAAWMGETYNWLGLSVAAIHQDMTPEARRGRVSLRHHLCVRQRAGVRLPARRARARSARTGAAAVCRRGDRRSGLDPAGRGEDSARHRRRHDRAVGPRRSTPIASCGGSSPHVHFTLEQIGEERAAHAETAWRGRAAAALRQSLRRRESLAPDRGPGRAARAHAAATRRGLSGAGRSGPVDRRAQGPRRARPPLAGGTCRRRSS